MSQCRRCELLPEPLPEHGRLYLMLPLSHSLGKLKAALAGEGFAVEIPQPGTLVLEVERSAMEAVSALLLSQLNRAEIADSRALLTDAPPSSIGISDLARVESLGALIARIRGGWLLGMLAEEKVRTVFQPIVSCSDPQQLFAYECLARGEGARGDTLLAEEILRTARDADLLFHLDRTLRIKAVRSAAELGIHQRLFINFNPASIYDPEHCLATTVTAARDAGMDPGQLVFEVTESDRVGDLDHLQRVLDFYRAAGFGVALDDLGAGYSSLNMIARLRPDFVKLDMDLIRDVDQDPYKAVIASKILEMTRTLGIASIAEGVETEGEFRWAKAHSADFMQGFLIAHPESPPPLLRIPNLGRNHDGMSAL